MKKHLEYFKYVVRHKWWVFIAGIHAEVKLWRLIKHDWTKFLPSEWNAYAEYFYGPEKKERREIMKRRYMNVSIVPNEAVARDMAYTKVDEQLEEIRRKFNIAWLKHLNRCDHHWQHWLLVRDYQKNEEKIVKVVGEDDPSSCAIVIRNGVHSWRVAAEVKAADDCAPLVDIVYRANALIPQKMSSDAIREMAADWAGAGKALTGKWEFLEWYKKNKNNIILEPRSRQLLEVVLAVMNDSIKKAEEIQKLSITERIWTRLLNLS